MNSSNPKPMSSFFGSDKNTARRRKPMTARLIEKLEKDQRVRRSDNADVERSKNSELTVGSTSAHSTTASSISSPGMTSNVMMLRPHRRRRRGKSPPQHQQSTKGIAGIQKDYRRESITLPQNSLTRTPSGSDNVFLDGLRFLAPDMSSGELQDFLVIDPLCSVQPDGDDAVVDHHQE